MTFEEIQQVIERMLKVQQDIQLKQLSNTEAINQLTQKQNEFEERQARIQQQQEANAVAIANLTENVSNLNVTAQRHEDRLRQLYGYQITSDSDRLNLMQGINDIRRRLIYIEEQLNAR